MKKLLFALACIILVSCNDDDNKKPNDGRTPISLSSSLTAELQRISREYHQIAGGQQVSFFVTERNNPSVIAYNNARLTANGSGGFTINYEGTDNAVLYYPLYEAGSDFYAIHPYNAAYALGTNHNFNIMADQSRIGNFLNSDLLFALRGPLFPSTSPVQLVFDHRLSKINFAVIAGDGTDLTGLTQVRINNVQPQAVLNTLTGAVTTGAAATTTVTAYGLADDFATVTPELAEDISAIVVPQTFPAGQTLFTLTINGIDFTYTPSQPQSFASGFSYLYRLTLTNQGIVVESVVNPWTPEDDREGEGIIQ